MKKRLLCILLAVMMIAGVLPFGASAWNGGGIRNNGLDGLWIDIYSAPYTTYANKGYGDPYGPQGCTWFAAARAYQITGIDTSIWSGQNWYNSAYSTYGYTRGTATPTGKALACYSGHVSVIEAVNGDTALVSEGGFTDYPQNDYCVISHKSMAAVRSNGFLGFVYLTSNPTPAVVSANFQTSCEVFNGYNGATISTTVTMNNASISQLTSAGAVIYDSHGTEIARKEEAVSYNTSYMNIWYKVGVGEEINVAMNPGTLYQYKFFVRIGGDTYVDSVRSFTTNGNGVYFDLNGMLNGSLSGSLGACGTADVYINGKLVADDVSDYNYPEHYNSTYEIRDIKAKPGYRYNGVYSGSLSGRIYDQKVSVVLKFDKDFAITAQPQNASAVGSNTARFSVQATGSGLSYQWQYRTSASGTWHDCTSLTQGYNTPEITVAGVSNSVNRNGFQYRCVVKDASGATLTSNPATFSVRLAAPTLTVKVNSKGQPVLTWTAVSSASKYEIWRATSENGPYTKLSTITSRELTNSSAVAGTTYYYMVRAVATDGTEGKFSAMKSAKATIGVPTLTVKLNSKGQPYLTWTAVNSAAKYEIWRATSSNGTYTKLATTTGKSLTNSSAKVGTTYYYKVRALGSDGTAGSFSSVKSIRARLGAPTVSVKLNAKGQPVLSWNSVSGAAKYEIWRATSAGGTYSKLTTTTYTTLTNTSVTASKTYYYKVRAVDANGYVGVESAVKSIRARLAAPTVTVKLNAKGQPVLTWNSVSGAAEYEVWRATSANGTYSKLITTNYTTLTNTSVTAGKTYYYKVRAVDVNNYVGVYSAVKSATAK